jgi:hypothetical protein
MKLSMLNRDLPTVVLFSPHAGIFPPSSLDNEVARMLHKADESLIKITCSGQLNDWCPVMTAAKVGFDSDLARRQAICASCKGISSVQSSSLKAQTIDLSELLSAEDELDARDMANSVDEENWRDFAYEGLPLGVWSAYNAMIDFKSPSPSARPDSFLRYKADLVGALKSAIAAKNLSNHIDIMSALSHSFEYSSPRAFLGVLRQAGVRTYTFYGDGHREFRHRLLTVGQANRFPDLGMDERYRRGLEESLSKEEVKLVHSHLQGILRGKGELEYSPPPTQQDLTSSLRVNAFKISALVLTSSPDEVEASVISDLRPTHLLHDNDLEFIRNVLSLAKSTPSVNFIIRVHPRLAPNRRDGETSHLLAEIRKFEAEAPSNVTWNFPEEGVSLYDILPIIHFAIAYRSSAAHEVMALGFRCFFVDPTKDPTFRQGGNGESGKDVSLRFSDFLKSSKSEPSKLVEVWRFLATHLMRVRIDVDGLYERRAPQLDKLKGRGRVLSAPGAIWDRVRSWVAPSTALILNFLVWSLRPQKRRGKTSASDSRDEPISLSEMVSAYRLWGTKLAGPVEEKIVTIASASLLASLSTHDRHNF